MNNIVKLKAKKSGRRSENPDPVDIHVGSRLRMRRNLVGLSQEQLGKSLGLTFQQIQKYERGINRMGSSRLFQMSKVLSVPIAYFFDEIPAALKLPSQAPADDEEQVLPEASAVEQADYDIMRRRETLELVRAYYRIQDAKQRRKVYELIRSMSEEQ